MKATKQRAGGAKRTTRATPTKGRSRPQGRIAKGSPRAQSWVYAALNPLIDVLGREVDWLSKGQIYWRPLEGRLELIRPPEEALFSAGQVILEDFQSAFPEEYRPIAKHGECLQELIRCAAAAHESLRGNPRFEPRVRELMEQYRKNASPDPLASWSKERTTQYIELVPQLLINRIPEHARDEDAEFWKQAEPVLREEFCDNQEFSRLQREIDNCREDAAQLINHLRTVRTRLCDLYDIPAAPVEGLVAPGPR